ncbi:kinase-like domain-containing protein, partial [Mycena rebaudengoi]
LQIASELGVVEHSEMEWALQEDEKAVARVLLDVLYSPFRQREVLRLEGEDAQSVLDVIQDILNRALLQTKEASSRARRLIAKLSRACDKFPSSLIISGVTERDEQLSFWGGFGDVFKAMYKGKPVALKHMRILQSTDGRSVRQKFYREALVWHNLHHPSIVTLIGIDTESFPSSLCLVSPWMKNGTVVKYLEVLGSALLTVLQILEISEGLAFLHAQNIVHGDLRGSNILVDDTGHACLTDFGLAVLSDTTPAAQTSDRGGCVRWMAPELLEPRTCGLERYARTTASDIYAFGCACLEVR